MAKQKLSQRDITSVKAGGYLHIILPTINPGEYASWKISADNLLAGVGDLPILLGDKTGNITQPIAANSWIDKITVFFKSGAPTIRIGTTPNGTDIMNDIVVESFVVVKPEIYAPTATDIYFTINTGNVDLRIDIKNSYNGSI